MKHYFNNISASPVNYFLNNGRPKIFAGEYDRGRNIRPAGLKNLASYRVTSNSHIITDESNIRPTGLKFKWNVG